MSIDGFYAAYFTGAADQGLAMLVFRNGTIVGTDVAAVTYEGTYRNTASGIDVNLEISVPANTLLVQGVNTGPQGDVSQLNFQLPPDFLLRPFIRIEAKHGPVNVKFRKLREING